MDDDWGCILIYGNLQILNEKLAEWPISRNPRRGFLLMVGWCELASLQAEDLCGSYPILRFDHSVRLWKPGELRHETSNMGFNDSSWVCLKLGTPKRWWFMVWNASLGALEKSRAVSDRWSHVGVMAVMDTLCSSRTLPHDGTKNSFWWGCIPWEDFNNYLVQTYSCYSVRGPQGWTSLNLESDLA